MVVSYDNSSITGNLKIILRMEGLAVLIATTLMYHHLGYHWKSFFILFFFPDISFAGYLFGKKLGCILYNFFHSYITPIALGILSWIYLIPNGQLIALIWVAHIGFDRSLGYGLKYAEGFSYTHLGRIGKI